MEVFHNLFHQVSSRFGDMAWSAHSPDLTVPDSLWGFLKEHAHRNRPHTTEELKRGIQAEIAVIDQDLLCRVFDNFVDHLRQ
jgi:hypothetical protein